MNKMEYDELALSSNPVLEEIFNSAITPSVEGLVGYEWRGFNLAFLTRILGIRKFIKGFVGLDDHIEGYNITVQQNGLFEPWIHKPSVDHPKRYAFFVISPVEMSSQDNFYPQALLLNYAASALNPPQGVDRLLRDYLVQPDPLNPNLLLGKAYFALGSQRVFSNFFLSLNACA